MSRYDEASYDLDGLRRTIEAIKKAISSEQEELSEMSGAIPCDAILPNGDHCLKPAVYRVRWGSTVVNDYQDCCAEHVDVFASPALLPVTLSSPSETCHKCGGYGSEFGEPCPRCNSDHS